MKLRDWKEVVVWASATAVIAVGLFGGTAAFSGKGDITPPQPSVVIDGVKITATAEQVGGKVDVVIDAVNPTEKAMQVIAPTTLISRKFKGSPISRVLTPIDFVDTAVGTSTPSINVPAHGSNTITIPFKTHQPTKPSPATPMMGGVTYLIKIKGDNGPLTIFVTMESEAALAK